MNRKGGGRMEREEEGGEGGGRIKRGRVREGGWGMKREGE